MSSGLCVNLNSALPLPCWNLASDLMSPEATII
jgi:hypothetical protein